MSIFINNMSIKPTLHAYRVWNHLRTVKVGVVATSLRELKTRACHRHGFHLHDACDMTLVLEECGTEVTEESYFKLLPAHSIFLLLNPGEKWTPALNSIPSVKKMEDFLTKLDSLTTQLAQELSTPYTPMTADQ